MAELTKCPKCSSVELELYERDIVYYGWTQTAEGINGSAELEDEFGSENIDSAVKAVCSRCRNIWTIPGSVEDLPGFFVEA